LEERRGEERRGREGEGGLWHDVAPAGGRGGGGSRGGVSDGQRGAAARAPRATGCGALPEQQGSAGGCQDGDGGVRGALSVRRELHVEADGAERCRSRLGPIASAGDCVDL
jgi:hypothetical protein